MHKSLDRHRDADALCRDILAWVADPASHACESLFLGTNTTLLREASDAMVRSAMASSLVSLRTQEVSMEPDQLAALLGMPALTSLSLAGGTSADWAGPSYVYPSLGTADIEVLLTSPHRSKLRSISLYDQELSEVTGLALRAAMPELVTLIVEGQSY